VIQDSKKKKKKKNKKKKGNSESELDGSIIMETETLEDVADTESNTHKTN